MGFRTVWVPEAVGREPFANAAMLLSATDELIIATGIASIHAPHRDDDAGGLEGTERGVPRRFLLGMGVSHQPMVEGVHKQAYDKPYSTMVEYLDAMEPRPVLRRAAHRRAPSACLPRSARRCCGWPLERGLGRIRTSFRGAHRVRPPGDGSRCVVGPEQMAVFETDPTTAPGDRAPGDEHYLDLPNYTNNLRRLGWATTISSTVAATSWSMRSWVWGSLTPSSIGSGLTSWPGPTRVSAGGCPPTRRPADAGMARARQRDP